MAQGAIRVEAVLGQVVVTVAAKHDGKQKSVAWAYSSHCTLGTCSADSVIGDSARRLQTAVGQKSMWLGNTT